MACDQALHRVTGVDVGAVLKNRGDGECESDWVERFLEKSPVLAEAEAMRIRKLLEYMGR